jgi:hypothetical protein
VSLSLISDSWYFIEFADGATQFFLPPAWHESVNGFTDIAMRGRSLRISTSYNATPSPLHRAPPPSSQVESFHPEYTPFVPNPLLMPAFTGVPQQQMPVYHVINMNNNPMPQPQKTSRVEKCDNVVKLVGSALTVVVAVLNIASGTGSTSF